MFFLLTVAEGAKYLVEADDAVYAAEELDCLYQEGADVSENVELSEVGALVVVGTSRPEVKRVVSDAE